MSITITASIGESAKEEQWLENVKHSPILCKQLLLLEAGKLVALTLARNPNPNPNLNPANVM